MTPAVTSRFDAPVAGPAGPPVPLQAVLDIATGLAAAPNQFPPETGSSTSTRVSERLLVTEIYEAWLLVWPGGSEIEPHDHGEAHGAFVVIAGALAETRW